MKKDPAPFRFKHFLLHQAHDVMKVSTDSILLGSWVNPKEAKNILDIGTGTGILALLMAQKSTAVIDAIDIDEKACSLARKNFLESPWSNRLNVYETSIQDYSSDKKYDLIISNPPYFSNSLKSPNKARNIYRHHSAITFQELLEGISKFLTDEGTAYLVLPFRYRSFLSDIFPHYHFIPNSEFTVRSHKHSTPYLCVIGIGRKAIVDCLIQEIVIYIRDSLYSEEYIHLTSDTYSKRH